MKHQTTLKIISLILSIVLLFEIIPFSGFAVSISNNKKIGSFNLTTDSSDFNEIEEIGIKSEIESERDEFTKVFLLEDDTYYSVSYSVPVHKSVNGIWENLNDRTTTPSTTIEADNLISELSAVENLPGLREVDGLTSNRMIVEGENSVLESRFLGPGNLNTIQGAQNVMWVHPQSISVVANGGQIATVSARITLDVQYFKKALGSNSTSVKTYEVLSPWDNNINYTMDGSNGSTQLNCNTRILDLLRISSVGSFTWDITEIYSAWERNVKTNNGVMFSNVGNNAIVNIGGYSLARRYRIISENDPGFSYQSIDMGRAGIVYMNEFTNTLRLEREECGLNGSIMPVKISRVFDFSNVNSSMNYSGIGARWNYQSYISSMTSDTYRWLNFQGNMVYFTRPSSNIETDNQNRQKWMSKDYEGFLWVDVQSSLNNDLSNNYIEGNDKLDYFFDSSGRVIRVEDEFENCCQILYAQTGIIDKIIDGAGRCYKFTVSNITIDQSVFSAVTSITVYTDSSCNNTIQFNNTNYTFTYGYCKVNNTSSGLPSIALSSVSYPDNETVTYTYDNIGRLLQITNNDGTQLSVTYINSTSKRATSLVKSKNNHPLQKIEADFHNIYLREITVNDTVETVTHYNANLDLDYKRSSDGTEYYYEYDEFGELKESVFPEEHDNLLESGDFEGNNSSYWFNDDGTTCSFPTEDGNTKLQITATENNEEGVYQLVEANALSGDCFAVYADMIATGTIPALGRNIVIDIFGLDENYDLLSSPFYSLTFDHTVFNEIQHQLGAFILDDAAEYLVFYIHISNQANNILFDNVGLYKASDNSVIDFTAGGNNSAESGCGCENCQNGDCLCQHEIGNTSCVCCNTSSVLNYDSFGNVIKSGIAINGKELTSTSEYTANGNYITSVSDENGIETTYTFNLNNGSLETVQEGSNNEINYSYNAMGMLTQVSETIDSLNNSSINVQYSYTHDKLSSIIHNGVTYLFSYDDYGNCISEKVKDINNTQRIAVDYSYDSSYDNSRLNSITYANGNSINYLYDANYDNVTAIYFGNNINDPRYTFLYDNNGELISSTDNDTGIVTAYSNDGSYTITDNSNHVLYSCSINNDDFLEESFFGTQYVSGNENIPAFGEREYDCETGETSIKTVMSGPVFENGYSSEVKYDEFNRVYVKNQGRSHGSYTDAYVFRTEYEYNDTATEASNQINSITTRDIYTVWGDVNQYGRYDEYGYDQNGRLTSIDTSRNFYENNPWNFKTTYEYDDNGQIIRENNQLASETKTYEYNSFGNISCVKTYNYTENATLGTPTDVVNYSYDSDYCDLLTSYDGNTITYDGAGNPLSCGNDHTFVWQGKQLISYKLPYELDDSYGDEYAYQKLVFDYDSEGNRSKKTKYLVKINPDNSETEVLNLTTYYIWNGDNLTAQQSVNPNGTVANTVKYLYGADGELYGIVVNNYNVYYFAKDQFGSITEVYSSSKRKVPLIYYYDAFGDVSYIRNGANYAEDLGAWVLAMQISVTYKGYLYDEDCNMFFLKSRFYSPEWKRFLNADSQYDTGYGTTGVNLFAYCNNDPVNRDDPSGEAVGALTIGGVTISIGAILAVVAGMLYLVDPNIRSAVNSAVYLLLFTAPSIVVEAVKRISKSISDARKQPKTKATETHHIVAKKAAAAEEARGYLKATNISVDHEANLVKLNKNFHKRLHTTQYYGAVNLVVRTGYNKSSNKKAGVLGALLVLNAMLKISNSVFF